MSSDGTVLRVYSLPPRQESDLGTRYKWLSKTSAFTALTSVEFSYVYFKIPNCFIISINYLPHCCGRRAHQNREGLALPHRFGRYRSLPVREVGSPGCLIHGDESSWHDCTCRGRSGAQIGGKQSRSFTLKAREASCPPKFHNL